MGVGLIESTTPITKYLYDNNYQKKNSQCIYIADLRQNFQTDLINITKQTSNDSDEKDSI